MRKVSLAALVTMLVSVLVAWSGPPGGARAQLWGPVTQSQGVLTAVSPDGQTFSISGPLGTQEFVLTSMTAIYAGIERVDPSRLPEFVGLVALVWGTSIGDELIAGRVTFLVFAATGVAGGFSDRGGGREAGGGGTTGGGGGTTGGASAGGSTGGGTSGGGGGASAGGSTGGGTSGGGGGGNKEHDIKGDTKSGGTKGKGQGGEKTGGGKSGHH